MTDYILIASVFAIACCVISLSHVSFSQFKYEMDKKIKRNLVKQ